MAGKKVSFGTKPKKKASVDDWVENREASAESTEHPKHESTAVTESAEFASATETISQSEKKADKQAMKRLTLDIPESLHRRIKGTAVMEGVTMVNMLRELLEETYG